MPDNKKDYSAYSVTVHFSRILQCYLWGVIVTSWGHTPSVLAQGRANTFAGAFLAAYKEAYRWHKQYGIEQKAE